MKTELKETMFEAGNKYKCLKSLDINGVNYFTAGIEYECKANNCLMTNLNEENFITQTYLSNFFE